MNSKWDFPLKKEMEMGFITQVNKGGGGGGGGEWKVTLQHMLIYVSLLVMLCGSFINNNKFDKIFICCHSILLGGITTSRVIL